MPPEQTNQQRLRAALGYVELGMFEEANLKIEEIDPLLRHAPEVLALRLVIYRRLGKWDLMEVVARKLVECNPRNPRHFCDLAYATRQAQSLYAASRVLSHAAELHPNSAVIQLNLAYYQAQLGNLVHAAAHLTKATALNKRYGLLAVDDRDLELLWKGLSHS